ncbi:MAG: hypothetical protein LKG27_02510 [Clostridiaceae bacterium]|jgi:hypothetical protein|nr:hypothetical protein [Clostridiaceae bacterium]
MGISIATFAKVLKVSGLGLAKMGEKPLQEIGKDSKAIEMAFKNGQKGLSQTIIGADGSLARTLSNGNKVVIKNTNGITSRMVYDRSGSLLVNDTKTFGTEQVGNKIIRTKKYERTVTDNIRGEAANERVVRDPNMSYRFNYKADRVYDGNNNFLGMRETETAPATLYKGEIPSWAKVPGKTYVTKTVPTKNFLYDENGVVTKSLEGRGFVKTFNQTENGNRVISKDLASLYNSSHYGAGAYKPIFNASTLSSDYMYQTGMKLSPVWTANQYNLKGLPMPIYCSGTKLDRSVLNDKSLKEMRMLSQEESCRLRYLSETERPIIYSDPSRDGLEFLDKIYS